MPSGTRSSCYRGPLALKSPLAFNNWQRRNFPNPIPSDSSNGRYLSTAVDSQQPTTGAARVRAGCRAGRMSDLTHVELLWLEKRIENWIRFGRHGRGTDSRSPAADPFVYARQHLCVRALGRQRLRHRHLPHRHPAAVAPGQRCATVPYVRPGGDILLRLSGWAKVERVLQDCRCRRGARHRSGRRSPGLLASRP